MAAHSQLRELCEWHSCEAALSPTRRMITSHSTAAAAFQRLFPCFLARLFIRRASSLDHIVFPHGLNPNPPPPHLPTPLSLDNRRLHVMKCQGRIPPSCKIPRSSDERTFTESNRMSCIAANIISYHHGFRAHLSKCSCAHMLHTPCTDTNSVKRRRW